jgi:hypothetical protein
MLAPLLTKKQIQIVLSGGSTGGALHAYKILKEMRVSEPVIGETDILPYAARLISPTQRYFIKSSGDFSAAFLLNTLAISLMI